LATPHRSTALAARFNSSITPGRAQFLARSCARSTIGEAESDNSKGQNASRSALCGLGCAPVSAVLQSLLRSSSDHIPWVKLELAVHLDQALGD